MFRMTNALVLLIALWVWMPISCITETDDGDIKEFLAGCTSEMPGAYNYSLAKWNKDTIFYENVSGRYPLEVEKVVNFYANEIGIPIIPSDSVNADIRIFIEAIDGGGNPDIQGRIKNTLGLSPFPHFSAQSENTLTIIIDEYDLGGVEGATAHDFFLYLSTSLVTQSDFDIQVYQDQSWSKNTRIEPASDWTIY